MITNFVYFVQIMPNFLKPTLMSEALGTGIDDSLGMVTKPLVIFESRNEVLFADSSVMNR